MRLVQIQIENQTSTDSQVDKMFEPKQFRIVPPKAAFVLSGKSCPLTGVHS